MNKGVALISGLLFGLGLMVSGMADPDKVIGFLDVSRMADGSWDPALMMVMSGALGVYLPLYFLVVKPRIFNGDRPLFADKYHLPTVKTVDGKLVLGAILFGVGWGVAGMCPGPAIVNLSSFDPLFILFVIAMVAGQFLTKLWRTRQQQTAASG
ncbi:YeeE/YedE family protein [Shewanella sp. Scap07]|uniref:DUF6691 family protein n=1 Tax=Shewanella sp. Scap07 TaxID=2589987 RepID=UPI0015B80799|nr:DUF6691 family protein [Shewanella sp. Scap07]QLE86707.1 YeeE/YedE family protein [Shewanella sp. Scap07]